MIQNTGPTKLPVIILPILAAGIMAISGYVLFSVRYGGPIREANLATKRVQELEEALPEMILAELANRSPEQSISRNDIGNSDSKNEKTLSNPFDPNPLTQRQDQLDTHLNDAESRIVQLENAVKAMQFELSYYRQSSPERVHQPSLLAQDDGTTSSPQIPPLPEQIILASDTKNDVQVAIHKAWTTEGRIILETTITNLSPEDGYFAIENYSRDSAKKRITTTDGLVISSMRIQQPGESEQTRARCDLIPGVPMKFIFYFYKGDIPNPPFMARRIEFIAYTDRASKVPLLFQFDNVVIAE